MSKLITFIIPCHNAEATLQAVVESICKQFPSELIEVLLVENASTDQTYVLAQELSDTYNEITLFQSEQGVSKARNLGLLEAQGDYIVFVDADDVLLSGIAEKMINELRQTTAEMVIFPYHKDHHTVAFPVVSDKEQAIVELLMNPTLYMTVWAKAFKREFLLEHQLAFSTALKRSEDSLFILEVLTKLEELQVSQTPFYHYETTTQSTVRGHYVPIFEDYLKGLEAANPLMTKFSEPNIQNAFNGFILSNLSIVMVRDVFSVHNTASLTNKYKRMTAILAEDLFSQALKNLTFKDCLSLYYLPYLFLKLHLKPLSALVYLAKASLNKLREG